MTGLGADTGRPPTFPLPGPLASAAGRRPLAQVFPTHEGLHRGLRGRGRPRKRERTGRSLRGFWREQLRMLLVVGLRGLAMKRGRTRTGEGEQGGDPGRWRPSRTSRQRQSGSGVIKERQDRHQV